ncbi:MAG: hypothetical protein F6K31_13215 [Symploca sp. SIO2G7]|nr:hypothetical protein [Symploca sp. SIO2G7]
MAQSRTVELGDRHSITYLIGRAAFITQHFKKKGKGGRMSRNKAAYYAFDDYSQAQRFYQVMKQKYGRYRVELREAQRVLDWHWEVKVQGDFMTEEIEAIAASLDRFYPDTMPQPKKQKVEKPVTKVATNFHEPGSSAWWLENFAKQPKSVRRKVALFC